MEIAEIAALTVLSAAGLAAAAGIGYAVLRARARLASSRREVAERPVILAEITHGAINAVPAGPPRTAIEPPRAAWPPPGWREEVKPRIGRDGHRPGGSGQ